MVDKKQAMMLREHGKTYQAVADIYRVSRQRIHQLLSGYHSPSKKRLNEQWQKSHPDEARQSQRKFRDKIKVLVLTHYGNGRCACVKCGFSDIKALSIDHIEGNGSKHRREIGCMFYRWLIKSDYPQGFQTLCMNCQFIKRFENRHFI